MSKRLTPDSIRKAIVAANYHYARAAELLGVSPDTLRSRITSLKAHGHEFPKSRARGGKNQPPERSRKEMDETRNQIRKSLGLPAAEYDHDRGSDEEILPPTQGEWDFGTNDFGDGA